MVAEKLVEYRDWLAMVAGEKMCEDYHFVLMDTPLARQDIWEIEKNRFWMSAHDTWQQLQKTGLNPSSYDLVWSMWAWKNIDDAKQMYGGGALLGPDTTPFMSFSVSRFQKRDPGITMVLEHEAQHTYEFLWAELGYPLITDPGEDLTAGWPHADYLPRLLRSIVDEEPGLFAPLATDEEVLQYSELKMLPSRLQSAVHAWVLRRWPRKRWLELAPTFGTVVSPRSSFLQEPLFSSITIIAPPSDGERPVFIPVRLREQGRHIPNLEVEGVIEGDRVILHENVYLRHQKHRLPPQRRWSIGWKGESYYATWTIVPLDSNRNLLFSIYVQEVPLFKPITIPIRVIGAKAKG